MHDVAGRLTSLHDQLNQYVYLTENLQELRTNVQQIQNLHSNVEQEKSTIGDLVERANQTNPQLATLSQDLEEKRVEVSIYNSLRLTLFIFSIRFPRSIVDLAISSNDSFNKSIISIRNTHVSLNGSIRTTRKSNEIYN